MSEQTSVITMGAIVRLPFGKLGSVVSQPYTDPIDELETVLVYQKGVGTLAYATRDLVLATAQNTNIGMILEPGSYDFTYVRLLELDKRETSDLCIDGDVA